jgi:transcriptional regulator with XRE-family HTH domain
MVACEGQRKAMGKQLKAFRLRQGLSLYRVAKNGNLRIETVQSVEAGEKAYTIDALLGYLQGVGLNIYFGGIANN